MGATSRHCWKPLMKFEGRRVTVQGIGSKPELNGQQGTCHRFDEAAGRYSVKLDSGETKSFKPGNLTTTDSEAGGSGLGGFQLPDWIREKIPKELLAGTTGWMPFLAVACYLFGGLKLTLAAAVGVVAITKGADSPIVRKLNPLADRISGLVFQYTGHQLDCQQTLCLMGAAVLFSGYYVLANRGAAALLGKASDHTGGSSQGSDDPYQQGYDDARAGRPRRFATGA